MEKRKKGRKRKEKRNKEELQHSDVVCTFFTKAQLTFQILKMQLHLIDTVSFSSLFFSFLSFISPRSRDRHFTAKERGVAPSTAHWIPGLL